MLTVSTARVLIFLTGAVAGVLSPACTSTRSLTPSERQLVFTVDTLRQGGVLVPIPFEQRYVTERHTDSPGGGSTYSYVFDPPHDIGFPVFLQSEASIYTVPGHAFYAGAVFALGLTFAGIEAADTIDVTSEFPNLADEASLLVFRDQGGQIGAFILIARRDRRALSVALAGPPAADPELWFGPARRCLKQLDAFDRENPNPGPTNGLAESIARSSGNARPPDGFAVDGVADPANSPPPSQ